jgi:CDP-diacylglycerol---glycerol-3-phosphate 3-phosphatidyltransferase
MNLELRRSVPTAEKLTSAVGDGCQHHGCVVRTSENVVTLASGITLLRTVGCLASVLASVGTGRAALLFVGLAIHCVGDVADGIVARHRGTETRAGAVLDIVCDRLCVAAYYLVYGELHHEMLIPIGVFLFSFMVLDSHLSLAFLNWPLRSLNYFYLVDRTLYRWNWSPIGKTLNGGAFPVLMLATHSPAACTVLALGISSVKIASLLRLHRAGVPTPTGCASAVA